MVDSPGRPSGLVQGWVQTSKLPTPSPEAAKYPSLDCQGRLSCAQTFWLSASEEQSEHFAQSWPTDITAVVLIPESNSGSAATDAELELSIQSYVFKTIWKNLCFYRARILSMLAISVIYPASLRHTTGSTHWCCVVESVITSKAELRRGNFYTRPMLCKVEAETIIDWEVDYTAWDLLNGFNTTET